MTQKQEEKKAKLTDEQIEKSKNMAYSLQEASRGIITERQALAAILYKGSTEDGLEFLDENLSAGDVAKIMDIHESTVYSLSSKGMNKLAGAKFMIEIVENEPWWSFIKSVDQED